MCFLRGMGKGKIISQIIQRNNVEPTPEGIQVIKGRDHVYSLGVPVIFLIPNYIMNLGFKIRCKLARG